MLPFLLKFTSELYDFPSNNSQFECQFLQLSEHRKGFLLRKIAFQSDYSLVIIHPDTAEIVRTKLSVFGSNRATNDPLLSLERSH